MHGLRVNTARTTGREEKTTEMQKSRSRQHSFSRYRGYKPLAIQLMNYRAEKQEPSPRDGASRSAPDTDAEVPCRTRMHRVWSCGYLVTTARSTKAWHCLRPRFLTASSPSSLSATDGLLAWPDHCNARKQGERQAGKRPKGWIFAQGNRPISPCC
jgi:hypothetical protein